MACDLHSPALDVESVVGPLPDQMPPAGSVRHTPPRARGAMDELAPREWFAVLEPDRPISEYGYARCPLHDDHIPSLKLYDEPLDGWYCWACARGGDLIEYASWRWHGRASRGLGASEFRGLVARLQVELGIPRGAPHDRPWIAAP